MSLLHKREDDSLLLVDLRMQAFKTSSLPHLESCLPYILLKQKIRLLNWVHMKIHIPMSWQMLLMTYQNESALGRERGGGGCSPPRLLCFLVR